MNNKLMFALIFGIMLLGMVSAITVTLNSPADGSTQLNPVNLNITSSTTAQGLMNVTLWDNSTGTWDARNITYIANGTIINAQTLNTTSKTDGGSAYNLVSNVTNVSYVDNLTFELINSAATAYGKVIIVYTNGTQWNSPEQSGTGVKTVSGLSLLNAVSSVTLWMKSSSGGTEVTAKNLYVYGYNNPLIISKEITLTNTYNLGQSILFNAKTCDSTGTCTFATSNRTFNVANLTFNSLTYNTTSYETAYESYIANISTDALLTSVKLDYNGTEYTMTQSGNLWSYSKSIATSNIGNNSIRLKYTYNGDVSYSDYYYQNISSINISACNGVYTQKYINFTFIDEATGLPVNSQITSMTLNYKLHPSSTVSKTLTYSNTTEVPFYTFCAIPTDKTYYINYSISYKNGTTYPQRISEIGTTAFTNATTNTTLYLLSSSTGIYVTFQLTNAADQLLSGVSVNATRVISGVTTTVAVGTTSASGTVTFWLNPDALHTFTFAKSGYTTYVYTDYPTQASYTVSLTGGGTSISNDYTKGIQTYFYPKNNGLDNDTAYNFMLNLTSSYWELDSFGFNLRLLNGTIVGSGSSTTEGTAASLSYNTNNQSIIYMDYYWVVSGNYTYGSTYWIVTNTENTGWSIKTFFSDLDTYLDSGIFGLDNFGRYLIIFLILFLAVGIMSYKYGATSPIAITSLTFAIVFFFDVVIRLIPAIRGIDYLLTYITGLALVATIISEVAR